MDAIRALTRVGLTVMFVLLTGAIWFTAADGELKARIVESALAMTAMCVSWWFAGRQLSRESAGGAPPAR